MRNYRTTDRRNHRTGMTSMSYPSLVRSAVDWAFSKAGRAYSQPRRTQENIFGGSSLVARTYSAQDTSPSQPQPTLGMAQIIAPSLFLQNDNAWLAKGPTDRHPSAG